MKTELHHASDRGKGNVGWLHSRFSFSFADYYNPQRMGFGKLRVLNDDVIAAGTGFDLHSHRDMEIITIVTEGTLEHKDSTGVVEFIKTGEIQVMSAGSGIVHSEYNHSQTEPLKLFQIWIETKKRNGVPRHDTRSFTLVDNELNIIVSKNEENTLHINQDAKILLGKFMRSKRIKFALLPKKGLFIFIVEGEAMVEGEKLGKRDALAVDDTTKVNIEIKANSFIMAIEVPM